MRSIVTDKRAFAFYEKWFTGTLILTIEFFLAGLFAELREEGIEDTPGLRQVITRNVDKNADGVVDIHELNEFFRDIWVESGVDDLLREGEE